MCRSVCLDDIPTMACLLAQSKEDKLLTQATLDYSVLVVMEGGERRDAEIGDGNDAGRVPSLDLYLAPSEALISSEKTGWAVGSLLIGNRIENLNC